jgi:hypothetical protein
MVSSSANGSAKGSRDRSVCWLRPIGGVCRGYSLDGDRTGTGGEAPNGGGVAIILDLGTCGGGRNSSDSGSRKGSSTSGMTGSRSEGSVGEPFVACRSTKVFWLAVYGLLAGSLCERIRDAGSTPDIEGRERPFSKPGLGERAVVAEF